MATTTSMTPSQIKVSTTLPYIDKLEPIKIDHPTYIIRPLLYPSDIEAYHSLWKQPMIHLDQGKNDTDPHTDMGKTQDRLLRITKALPSQGIQYGIFNKKDGREGELIGEGGIKISESSWPSIYYTFRKDYSESIPHFLHVKTLVESSSKKARNYSIFLLDSRRFLRNPETFRAIVCRDEVR